MLARLHDRPFVLVATTRPGLENRWTPAPGKHNGSRCTSTRSTRVHRRARARAVLRRRRRRDRRLPARTQRRQPVLRRGARRVRAGDARQRASTSCPRRCTVSSRPASTRSNRPSARCSRTARSSARAGRSPRSLALADRADARRLLDGLAERDFLALDDDDFHFKSELIHEIAYGTLTKAERARRHALRRARARGARRAGDRPGRAPPRHRGRAGRRARRGRRRPGRRARAGHRHADARRRARRVGRVVALAGRHHDRALGLLPPEHRRRPLARAARPGRAAVQPRALDDARDDVLAVLTEATAAGDRPARRPTRSRCSATAKLQRRRVRRRRGDLRRGARALARARRRVGRRQRAARARHDAPLPRRPRAGGTVRLRGARLVPLDRQPARRGVGVAEPGVDLVLARQHPPRRERLEESADLFGELGDWGGLSWAYGLLAFVRYNQGRLEEAAAIAEHIAIEGRETGNRWAVGMMDVLLAQRALWSGRTHECVERGSDAIELFQEIGDRWGEVMATGSVVRAHAELGHDDEYADTLAHYRAISRDMPDEGMRTFPAVDGVVVQLQQGRPDAAQAILETLDIDDRRRRRPARRRRRQRRGRARAAATRRRRRRDRRARTRLRGARPTTARRWRSAAGSRSRTRSHTAPTTPTHVIAELNAPRRRHVLRPHDRAVGREPRAHAAGRGDARAASTPPTRSRPRPTRRSSTRSPRSPGHACSRRSAPTTPADAAADAATQLDEARAHRPTAGCGSSTSHSPASSRFLRKRLARIAGAARS